jgi:hypothetical protein
MLYCLKIYKFWLWAVFNFSLNLGRNIIIFSRPDWNQKASATFNTNKIQKAPFWHFVWTFCMGYCKSSTSHYNCGQYDPSCRLHFKPLKIFFLLLVQFFWAMTYNLKSESTNYYLNQVILAWFKFQVINCLKLIQKFLLLDTTKVLFSV